MSDSLRLPPNDSDPPQIQQDARGDRNQIIGQAVSSTIINVTGGGQVTIYQSQLDRSLQAEPQTPPSKIGPNPYKGLLAFQETDGDRFFGREKQIEQLWQKFRSFHEQEAAIRVLPIYGPSGSGKSSLARAGLIPELARRPLPGRDRARVAVLVPGTHPLEALATVLARVATDDLTPVTKTREFAGELAQVNQMGEYDGLRRIADVLPDIAISPLIVLVDQFEEVYTLCDDATERDRFVENLLCAAAERSQRVSVIVTLRSDFLGETQKHPLLNRLFSEQGFLVPAMNQEELRQAIEKPAELAGHPLDRITIAQLVQDTAGRDGALPLLQFALTRIWEGLVEGKPAAETLNEIGGVGGALAGEAERIYQQLDPEQQQIARRVFLGLVQPGEGTKDTRRRAPLNSLGSYRNHPDQVKRVIELFSAPGARLITLATTSTRVTVEVTHEALFEHWKQLQNWLEGSRSDIRFQRRLDEAAQYWAEQERPEGSLWRPPDLDLLKRYQQRAGEDMTPLQMEFFMASQEAEEIRQQQEERQQRFKTWAMRGLITLSLGAMCLTAFVFYQLQQVQRQRVEQLVATAKASLLTQSADAEISAIAAVGLSRANWFSPLYSMAAIDFRSLLHSILINKERNLLLHEAPVTAVAFSPDGKKMISGTHIGTMRLWNADTQQLIGQPWQAYQDAINSVAFSPDSKIIASGSRDKTLRLWDARTAKLIGQPLEGHEDWVTAIAFSPDGKTIVSGSNDKTLRLWDARTGKSIGQPLEGHEDGVVTVAFSPDGQTIVSGSDDKTIRLWDAKTGQPIGQPLEGHEDGVGSVAFNPDGKMIVSGSNDKTLRLWDARTGKSIGQPLEGHEDAINSVAFSPDGTMIASSSSDKTLRLWDVSTAEPIGQPLQGHGSEVWSIAFSPDGKTIASVSSDKTLRLWDTSMSQPIGQPLLGHKIGISAVAISPDSKRIVSAGYDRILRLWDATTGKPIGHPLRGHKDKIYAVAFSPDGTMIASGSWDRTVRLWDARTGKPIGQPLRGHRDSISSVAFSPSGKMIVSGSRDQTLRLWNASTGEPIGPPLSGHKGIVASVAFSPDGKTIVSGSWDKTLRLWNAETGEAIGQPLGGHAAEVYSVDFSPDGRTIVSAHRDRTVRLWNASTGELVGKPLYGHEDVVSSVDFSPDGKMIVSGSWDKTIRLWEAHTHQPIGPPLRGHEVAVNAVTFAPDSRTIVSGSSDKTVRLWVVSWEGLLQTACNQLRHHTRLLGSETDVAKEAKQTCEQHAWNTQ